MRRLITFLLVTFLLLGCANTNAAAEPTTNPTEAPTEAIIEPVSTESEVIETEPPTEPEPTKPPLVERYEEVPMFFQTDYPHNSYGGHGSVATHGCGIASLSMVASYLLDRPILPDELAKEFGRYNTEHGSSWNLFPKSAEKLGLTIETQTWKWADVEAALKEGKVAIANATGGSPFTQGGHFVVLTGINEDGRVTVNDPYKGNYSQWTSKVLKEGFANGFEKSSFNHCFPMWIYSAKDPAVITNTTETIQVPHEIIKNEDMIPYYVYSPENVDENEELPVIFWLHNTWEKGLSELAFTNISFPRLLENWPFDIPEAYIICPQLKDNYKVWDSKNGQMHVETILEDFAETHNIDRDRIVIMGQGIGGQGVLYMLKNMPDTFSAGIVLSPNYSDMKLSEITTPVKAFAGSADLGENRGCVNFMNGAILKQFGEDNIAFYECAQANVPELLFFEDKDENNQSDILEWALSQKLVHPVVDEPITEATETIEN